ncbi:MAG: hypothetical protein Q3M24_03365 [Candidatus Electrothrix aestuarii]|uniref:SMODS-associating 2TM beta-strand rich effector domain-containing protein n=1 Tax=Candidatus Electrothrix aestuarii TaxID=3062594 RepID=A0AAU8LY56_9BACT|nr:hypothetical protein [Candidatus Electrothrix aestuarii]
MKLNIASSLLATIIISLISVSIGYLIDYLGIYPGKSIEPIFTSFFLLFFLFLLFRRRIIDFLMVKIFNLFFANINKHSGLVKIYENFNDASDDIKNDFKISSNVSIFIQLGRGVIGGKHSLLFDEARGRVDKNFKFRVLFSNLDSKWLSHERAEKRNSNHREWEVVVGYNIDNVSVLECAGVNLEAREHSEPYLWRLFFFDNTLYFIPYLYERNNSHKAHVYKFKHIENGPPSFYTVFKSYYEDIWEKNKNNIVKKTKE